MIQVGPAQDPARFLATDRLVWFQEEYGAPVVDQLIGIPEDQRFAALVDDSHDEATYAGIYGVRPMQLCVPGRSLVDCAGLTWVGVHPDHKRRGILTAMLRHHFEETRRAGVAISALHASEPAIYGRHGYGLASLELTATLGSGTTFSAAHLDVSAVRTHLVSITDPGIPERMRACDLSLAADTIGSIIGETSFYAAICNTPPEERRDKEIRRVLFAIQDGHDIGWVPFQRTHKWDNERPSGTVSAGQIRGGPAAKLALARRLVDLDLAGSVKIHGVSQDDPLLSWLDGPRATGDLATYDSLWVRLVDLPAALASRGYDDSADVVVEVTDLACPWNTGRWRLQIADGACAATRSDDPAELSLPVSALGASYLGGGNLVAMARAGVIAEHRPGAALELWRAMRTEVAPYASIGF